MQLPLAVVLLNYNGLYWLRRFFPNVLKYSPKDSVYVIDNSSTDESISYLQHQLPKEHLLSLPTNLGYAGGYNEGLQKIKAHYYLLLNTDVFVEEGWWQPLLKWIEKRPKVAACQPKLLSYSKEPSSVKKFDYAGAAGGLIDPLCYPYCRGRIFSHTEDDHSQYDEKAFQCDWVSGACCLVRAEAFWAVDGFDRRFFMHMEEIDLCWRLHKLGYSTYCCPEAEVTHIGGGSLPSNSPKKAFLNFRNSLLLLQKQQVGWHLCWRLTLRTILDIIAVLYFSAKGHFLVSVAIVRAHLSFYNMWHTLPQIKSSSSELPYPKYNIYILYAYFIKKKRFFSHLGLPTETTKRKTD